MLAAWMIHNEGIYAMEISQHCKSSIVLSSILSLKVVSKHLSADPCFSDILERH